MMNELFSLRHGQTGRLEFNIITTTDMMPVVTGGILVNGRNVPMVAGADAVLYIPVLPPGVYLMEVRCAGATVLYSELEVQPSPLGQTDGVVVWSVDADLTQPPAVVEVHLHEGPQGERGEQGPKGEQGEPFRYEDLSAEQRAELAAPALAELTEEVLLSPAGTAEDNFNSYGFVCVVSCTGKITQLDIDCRASGSAEPGEDVPVYAKVWRGSAELLARSSNAQTHAVEATLSYRFEPFEVVAGDEIRVTYHTEDGLTTDAYQMGRMVCQRAVALTMGETGGMLNSAGIYSNTSWTAKYTWHLQVGRFAPAAHAADTTVHVTEWEKQELQRAARFNGILTANGTIVVPVTLNGTFLTQDGMLPLLPGSSPEYTGNALMVYINTDILAEVMGLTELLARKDELLALLGVSE